ncbi:MAG: hypothetical protein QW223_07665 [Candidatus Caldarchaeum sp.]
MSRLKSTTVFMSFILVAMLLAVGFSVVVFSIIPPARDIVTAEIIANNSEPVSKSGVNIPVSGSHIYFMPVLHLREAREYDIGEAVIVMHSDGKINRITCPPRRSTVTNYIRLCSINIPLTETLSTTQLFLETARIDKTYVSNIPLASIQVSKAGSNYVITRLEVYSQHITGGIIK